MAFNFSPTGPTENLGDNTSRISQMVAHSFSLEPLMVIFTLLGTVPIFQKMPKS